ncbi:MAG: hypothetical protein EHM47_18270 [Ignavibacteriales bacterium]|nr:MAG: hypothetical protein EHM47_18270 [Ignavibacteriales bacterium]
MPFCPKCNYEYIEGITICPDCGTHLVDESVYEKPEDWTEDNWEVVYTSNEDYEVEMLKDNLESAGITAAILQQKDRNFPAPGDLAVIKLLVRREDMEAALGFIQKVNTENNEGEEES